MTSLADRTIAALRATHDDLATRVATLTGDQLTGPSGAAEWPVAQVLSHLGSGAEIGLAGYRAAVAGEPAPAQDLNQGVWDRWNAMTPESQAAGFVEHDARLVEFLEGLTAEQREELRIDLGFMPDPLSLGAVTGMRLNEAALHGWDVRVGLDPEATLTDEQAALLAEHFSGSLGFLLGFVGKAEALTEPAVVDIQGSGFTIVVAEGVGLTESGDGTTATFTGPLESAIRLLAGRLTPQHTAAGVAVSGNVTLDDLRAVFPGY
jgi:uncharacterized protein (TIGR03083 family)